jgi:hypothetical protein
MEIQVSPRVVRSTTTHFRIELVGFNYINIYLSVPIVDYANIYSGRLKFVAVVEANRDKFQFDFVTKIMVRNLESHGKVFIGFFISSISSIFVFYTYQKYFMRLASPPVILSYMVTLSYIYVNRQTLGEHNYGQECKQ